MSIHASTVSTQPPPRSHLPQAGAWGQAVALRKLTPAALRAASVTLRNARSGERGQFSVLAGGSVLRARSQARGHTNRDHGGPDSGESCDAILPEDCEARCWLGRE